MDAGNVCEVTQEPGVRDGGETDRDREMEKERPARVCHGAATVAGKQGAILQSPSVDPHSLRLTLTPGRTGPGAFLQRCPLVEGRCPDTPSAPSQITSVQVLSCLTTESPGVEAERHLASLPDVRHLGRARSRPPMKAGEPTQCGPGHKSVCDQPLLAPPHWVLGHTVSGGVWAS